jgi:hypothetical protein
LGRCAEQCTANCKHARVCYNMHLMLWLIPIIYDLRREHWHTILTGEQYRHLGSSARPAYNSSTPQAYASVTYYIDFSIINDTYQYLPWVSHEIWKLVTICTWAADPLQMSTRLSADKWQIIHWPNISLTKSNSFDLHISSSWNVNRNIWFQLYWNVFWKSEFQYPFQCTWNTRFRMHLFLYQNGKFWFTISVHLFCNLTPGISAPFQLV